MNSKKVSEILARAEEKDLACEALLHAAKAIVQAEYKDAMAMLAIATERVQALLETKRFVETPLRKYRDMPISVSVNIYKNEYIPTKVDPTQPKREGKQKKAQKSQVSLEQIRSMLQGNPALKDKLRSLLQKESTDATER